MVGPNLPSRTPCGMTTKQMQPKTLEMNQYWHVTMPPRVRYLIVDCVRRCVIDQVGRNFDRFKLQSDWHMCSF